MGESNSRKPRQQGGSPRKFLMVSIGWLMVLKTIAIIMAILLGSTLLADERQSMILAAVLAVAAYLLVVLLVGAKCPLCGALTKRERWGSPYERYLCTHCNWTRRTRHIEFWKS